mmetsp:Transcript_2362/g.7796  ORF Transcript_2362/g.7796 Transcript_2362/m.7796 type:complete len:163 (+) Transcript_2362:47-535(+)|eukprot:CAMPEP_0202755996 /NCGR_PEP_ID=MMETSP1388-20130828/15397_1 /ASSEMBLY_ACC=CAM_ASM_000864 /TAXON_ID=37098 /ORGANISM="Isochrysis sp, Strain CCMP1244" /LENGTH=162 /DNA_ID=CAMNT_0049423839 /DNA_START=1 /DNA_END=489 /DNA_ORIENTATION=-
MLQGGAGFSVGLNVEPSGAALHVAYQEYLRERIALEAWVDQQQAADAAGRHGHFRLVEELPDELLLHMLHILNLSDFELGKSSRDSPPLAVLRGAHTESRLACRRLRDACSELRTAAEASLSAECASWVRDIGYSGYRPHWSDWFSLWGDGPLADVLLAWRD